MATYDVKQIALPGGDIANLKDGNAIHKSDTSGFVKNDGSIDQNTYQIAQEGKGLSTNDFTNEDKALIGQTLGNNTVLTTDKTPFLTRQTLNPTGFSGYVREKLVGASYAWNQLVQNGNFANGTTSWTLRSGVTASVSGGICTITPASANSINILQTVVSGRVGRKIFVSMWVKSSDTIKITMQNVQVRFTAQNTGSNTWEHICGIYQSAETDEALCITNTTSTNAYQIKDVTVTDLTLAFGSTIADYLYGLSNNGGITKLRDMGCPIDKYTPYGYGLYSVKTSGKRVLSANLITGFYNGARNGNGTTYSSTTRVSTDGFISLTPNKYKIISKSNISGKTLRIAYHFWSNTTEGSNSQTYDSGWINLSETTELEITSNVIMDGTFSFTDNSNITPSDIEVKLVASVTTYSLGNDELRGKFDLVNGEIVASGDVKESNGGITRNYGIVDLGSLEWVYNSSNHRFYCTLPLAKASNLIQSICAKYVNVSDLDVDKTYTMRKGYQVVDTLSILISDSAYTDSATFKTAMSGIYLVYELATPTTEQSTPFADPMSMVGATTEEYIDTRDIPCPVGAERQYMGQSEDVVEIPSMPQSDGIRYMKAITSGGKTQLVWEDDIVEDVSDCFTAGNAYTSIGYCQAYKVNRTVTFRMRYNKLMDGTTPVIIMLDSKIRPLMPYQSCFRLDSSGLGLIQIADGGSAGGLIIDGTIAINQQVNVSGTFLTKN